MMPRFETMGTFNNSNYIVYSLKSKEKKLKSKKYFSMLEEHRMHDIGRYEENERLASAFFTNLENLVSKRIIIPSKTKNFRRGTVKEDANRKAINANISYAISNEELLMFIYASEIDPLLDYLHSSSDFFIIGLDLDNNHVPDYQIFVESASRNNRSSTEISVLKNGYIITPEDRDNKFSSISTYDGLIVLQISLMELFKGYPPSNVINLNLAAQLEYKTVEHLDIDDYAMNLLTEYEEI
ncbi:MAG: hypothetical protein R2879_00430 [Saprospiraceae bacterium]